MDKLTDSLSALESLVPLGTLFLRDAPRSNLQGRAPDGWRWFALPYNYNLEYCPLSESDALGAGPLMLSNVLIDIRYLLERCHMRITYKYFVLADGKSLIVLRIYVVPSDCKGAHTLAGYRTRYKRGKPQQWHDNKYKKIMSDLLKVVDYSEQSWNIDTLADVISLLKPNGNSNFGILIFPSLQPWQQFSAKFVGNGPYHVWSVSSLRDLNHHIYRLSRHLPLSADSGSAYSESASAADTLNKKTSRESTLLQIYEDIDILDDNRQHLFNMSSYEKSNYDNDLSELTKMLSNNDIPGIKSTLYRYQKESVSEMLFKELQPSTNLMPNLVALEVIRNRRLDSVKNKRKKFYLDLSSFNFKMTPEVYNSAKGGILSENMGLGKTCICLALICLTKYQVSAIPEIFYPFDSTSPNQQTESSHRDKLQPNSILKPLPASSNPDFVNNNVHKSILTKPSNVKSLAKQCAESINKNSVPWKKYLDYLSPTCIKLLLESPAYFDILEFLYMNRRQSSRLLETSGPQLKRLYLSSGTIIVVPNNLYYQWISEIKKHCIGEYLKVLYVPYHNRSINAEYVFPNELELIKYDLVLMGTSSFVNEFNLNSPLRKVYWKRFIIDEGHSLSSRTTRLVQMATELHVERRWLVSGTPTSGLTKLYVSEEVENSLISDKFKTSKPGRKTTKVKETEKQEYAVKRKFSAKDDLNRLGVIITKFFKISPWCNDPSLFTRTLVKPFMDNSYGSSQSLSNLLHGILIRHAIKTVEADIKLPPLNHKAVFLEPSYHNKLSINLFVSVLAANAVTSERVDQDYMFHPTNKQSLKRLITNLQRSTFHWVGFSEHDIESLVKICQSALDKKKDEGSNQYYHTIQDRILLRKCVDSAKTALENNIWRLNSSLHEMSYFVQGLPELYSKYFCVDYLSPKDFDPIPYRSKEKKKQGYSNVVSVYPYLQINSIQKFFFKNRFISTEDKLKEKITPFANTFWQRYWKSLNKKLHKIYKKDAKEETISLEVAANHSTKASSQSKDKGSANRWNSTLGPTSKKRKTSGATLSNDSTSYSIIESLASIQSHREPNTKQTRDAPIKDTRKAKLLGTLSAKLSYLGSRLLDHHVTGTKSIIFYQFEDSAYYLVELLDLLGLDYILYSTSIPINQRNSKLVEFDQHRKQTGITLIMDLKLASHGLTIIGATRMYFLSPVWKKTVEAQAIKRCHRIGQRNAVFVEILILQNTLEEKMYDIRLHTDHEQSNVNNAAGHRQQKSADANADETDVSGDVYDDTGMKRYFEAHNFLPLDKSNNKEREYCEFTAPALSIETQLIDTSGSSEYVDPQNEEQVEKYIAEQHYDEILPTGSGGNVDSSGVGLLKPVGLLDERDNVRKWHIPIFTETALQKINESQLKVNTFINEQQVINREFVDLGGDDEVVNGGVGSVKDAEWREKLRKLNELKNLVRKPKKDAVKKKKQLRFA